jgi:hypothetical protein
MVLAASLTVITKVVTDMKMAKKQNGGSDTLKAAIEVLRLEIIELRNMIRSIQESIHDFGEWRAGYVARVDLLLEQQASLNTKIDSRLAGLQKAVEEQCPK